MENDKEIERLGSKAAFEYMKWHEKRLEELAMSESRPATSLTLMEEESLDRRLYLTLRSNIAHSMVNVGGTILKSRRWADLLMCMQGRIPDYNFITLLRPDVTKSYQEQRSELLVVPRAQFVLVEIARCREQCYNDGWRVRERLRLSRQQMVLVPTPRFSVVESRQTMEQQERRLLFQKELNRQMRTMEETTEAAKRGDQLRECLSSKEAALRLPMTDEPLRQAISVALRDLSNGTKPYIVLDNVLSRDAASRMEKACLSHFESIGDARIAAQAIHRGDNVSFLPLFDNNNNNNNNNTLPETGPAKTILANLASLHPTETGLLVPRVGQLALYDGIGRPDDKEPGYVTHLDNCATVGDEGENYRELTAILYLNQQPNHSSGGAFRCFPDKGSFVDIVPRAGRLVVFHSRELLHEVTPVVGWRRLALSVWILKDSRAVAASKQR